MKTLKKFFEKYKTNLLIGFSIICFLIGVTNVYYTVVVQVISNDECLWIPKKVDGKDKIYFANVKENGVAWNGGIRNGDRLISINDVKLKNTFHAQSILNKMKSGEYARYTIEKNGKVIKTKVYIKKLVIFGNLGFSLLALIWLAVGFVVIMAKPNGRIQKLFYFIGVLSVFFMTIILISNNDGGNRIFAFIVDIIWSLAAAYLSFMLVYFFWNFPKPFTFVEKKWVKRIFFITPFVLFLVSYAYRWFFIYLPGNFKRYAGIIQINNLLILSALLIGLISLFINYRRLKTRDEKKPISIILIAYTLGVVSILYTSTVANIITDTIFNHPEHFMPIVLVAIIPISFGYSIFKYQLMDVSVVIKNAIVYGAATIIIFALYFTVSYILGQGIGLAIGTEYKSAIAAVAFIIFALIFQSTKNKFQDLLTKKFYPEQFNYQKMILRFSHDVVSIVGLENILDSMSEIFVSSLKVKKFAILLKESKHPNYVMKRRLGIEHPFLITDSNNLLTHYVREKLLIQVPIYIDRQQFHEIFPDKNHLLVSAEIFTIIPMVMKSKVIGLLIFGLKHSGSEFVGKDLELLCAAANQAAVAIENARLYESEAKKLAIERDLENARRIQEGLLPSVLPQIDGLDISGEMIPAMQVGGDYYDIIKVSPTQAFVIVGDVSGKGLSASLYMSKLQTMMRLYCSLGKSPKDILVDVNKKIYESIERNWFITVSSALIDTEKKIMKFCRAGHSPLLVTCNGSTKVFQSRGIGLGLEVGKIFEETLEEITIEYSPGQVFAFFSDGVSEAMNNKNDLFGIERIAAILEQNKNQTTSELMITIKSSLEEFRNGHEQNDDITMVLVKVN